MKLCGMNKHVPPMDTNHQMNLFNPEVMWNFFLSRVILTNNKAVMILAILCALLEAIFRLLVEYKELTIPWESYAFGLASKMGKLVQKDEEKLVLN